MPNLISKENLIKWESIHDTGKQLYLDLLYLEIFQIFYVRALYFKPVKIIQQAKQNMSEQQDRRILFQNPPPFSWFPSSHLHRPQYFPYQMQPPPSINNQNLNYSSQFHPIVKQEENFVKIQQNRVPTYQGFDNNAMINRNERNYEQEIQNQQIYWNTLFHFKKPYTDHKAIYFDPSAAPIITSEEYNTIDEYQKDKERLSAMKEISQRSINQLEFGQRDENPFIQYRFRRIKKKFKKFLDGKDLPYCGFENNDEDSEKSNSQSSESAQGSDGRSVSQKSRKIEKPIKNKKKIKRNTHKNNKFIIQNAFSINLSYVSKGNL